jgi:hypothetical protein
VKVDEQGRGYLFGFARLLGDESQRCNCPGVASSD